MPTLVLRQLGLFVLLFVITGESWAQEFTLADRLRGELSPARSCFDVHFYELDIAIDPDTRTVSGSNAIHFKVVEATDSVQIDLFSDLTIDSIVSDGKPLNFSRLHDAVFVFFGRKLNRDDYAVITVHYHGKPIEAKNAPWDGGFVWKQDANGKLHAGVACEELGASSWWPMKDHLSDEPDSMLMRYTIPNGLMCVGNGRLMSRTLMKHHTKWSWMVRNPINSYNVTFNIGDYVHFSDTLNGLDGRLDLNYYVLRQNEQKAREHFRQVKPMLRIFEEAFGPYPFYEDSYALVETPYVGMEHQSAIAYGNRYMPGYLGRYPSNMDFDYIIIHETGHEWWGNSVSINDIADMWVHESFCTYSESVYAEAIYGHDKMVEYLMSQKPRITNASPILGVQGFNSKGNGTDMYYKGAWMLHSLRSLMNDDAKFKSMLRAISTEFRHSTVDGDDIIRFINRFTGLDLSAFFAQYLAHKDPPVLEYMVKGRKMSLRWKVDEPDFSMPIEMIDGDGKHHRMESVTTRWKTYDMRKPRAAQFRHDRFLFSDQKSVKVRDMPKF
jgi:aminopeptidase N